MLHLSLLSEGESSINLIDKMEILKLKNIRLSAEMDRIVKSVELIKYEILRILYV